MSPLVMGILNVTPDSFSDGGRWLDPVAAVGHAREMIAAGADVVDVGGESTRPGADPVDAGTERERVLPVLAELAGEVRLSVDTSKPEVAEAAVEAGATLINDVSASLHEVAAACGVGWIAMHMRGSPRTMQQLTGYEDVVAEVRAFLVGRAEAGLASGVEEVWVDPGIGFAKTAADNWRLLARLDELVATGHPVMVGTSRKSFLGHLLGRSDGAEDPAADHDRLEGSVATATAAMAAGARMVRAHDVRATAHAARVVAA